MASFLLHRSVTLHTQCVSLLSLFAYAREGSVPIYKMPQTELVGQRTTGFYLEKGHHVYTLHPRLAWCILFCGVCSAASSANMAHKKGWRPLHAFSSLLALW